MATKFTVHLVVVYKTLGRERTVSLKIGETVRHRNRLDAGYGVIKELFDDGRCTAVFPEETFSGPS